MVRRRSNDARIYFPWERRGGGMLRRLAAGRARPLGLLVLGGAMVAAVVARDRRDAGVRRTRAAILDARVSVDAYMVDHDGACPESLAGLARSAGAADRPSDAWGRPLRLRCPGRENARYDVSSDGPDGLPDGLDRIE
ncbi:MAG: type II secretion system protein GspG [Deltaproteobacteria bacterium]|nr:type II secretion system protein GspG [Deltaproteobacteria bacterium]